MSESDLGNILKIVKDYWFLITLAISIIATAFYMLVYQVNPWDTYRDLSYRKRQVAFHNQVGFQFLEKGHFLESREEFDRALKLKATNYDALNGNYLVDLFLALDQPNWDPAVGMTIRNQLKFLGKSNKANIDHIIEKYMGDLHAKTNNNLLAERHYQKALELKADYTDALDELAWFYYFEGGDDSAKKMARLFKTMVDHFPYDYRGFHGLGYSLYMQALIEKHEAKRTELLRDSALQAEKAKDLKINQINTLSDFGEIARSAHPDLSIFYHQMGVDLTNDEQSMKLIDNAGMLGIRLLMTENDWRTIKTKKEKESWMLRQLALDHLALHRKTGLQGSIKKHEELIKQAEEIDNSQTLIDIYRDQLAILDIFLPKKTKE